MVNDPLSRSAITVLIAGIGRVFVDSPHPIGVPLPVLDEIYDTIPCDHGCRCPGNTLGCMKTVCDPGDENWCAESLILLPGEADYLRKRLANKGIASQNKGIEFKFNETPLAVELDKRCPYHNEDNTCEIYADRPIRCRSYPIRCHIVGEKSLAVFVATDCPATRTVEESGHYRHWVLVWRTLLEYVHKDWWRIWSRHCPAGYLHINTLLDRSDVERGYLPFELLPPIAKADCQNCSGSGVAIATHTVCTCIQKKDLKRLQKRLLRYRNQTRI